MPRSDHLGLLLVVAALVTLMLFLVFATEAESPVLESEPASSTTTELPQRATSRDPQRAESTLEDSEIERPVEPEGDPIEPARLEIRFRCPDATLLAGIEIVLTGDTGRSIPLGVTDEDGLVVFRDLRPGRYRWRHDGSLDIAPVPPSEEPAMTMVDGRVVVRDVESRSSAAFDLAAGELREIIVPFQPAACVTGRVTDALGTLARPMILKLITRERFVHPAGTEVLRIVTRQVGHFPNGEFRFERVRAGEMELLGYFNDEDGLDQLHHEFDLLQGESRDLGALGFVKGRTVTIELKARGLGGAQIPWSEIYADEDPHRIVQLLPPEPDLSWVYQSVEIPLGRPYELRGLGPQACELTFAAEDAVSRTPRPGWVKVGPPTLEIPPAVSSVELHEDWRRITKVKLRIAGKPLASTVVPFHLQIHDLESRRTRLLGPVLRTGYLELDLAEGRHRILACRAEGELPLAAESGEIRVEGEELEVDIAFELAGRLVVEIDSGRSQKTGSLIQEATGIRLELPQANGSKLSLDLPPGRYRHIESDREISITAGRECRLDLRGRR